ncbi:hypothetical protein SFRURICE_001944 [Spodoptera frugiperda]|nr:hypothetical protein SFRURICE_001944 [Spodoptera frugiperda]
MTEKNKSEKMTNASKPVPMKLFAAWEVDRTPSNCIPSIALLHTRQDYNIENLSVKDIAKLVHLCVTALTIVLSAQKDVDSPALLRYGMKIGLPDPD